ncbi:hypothetical protein ACFLRT_00650 [Acidobacteriota bacterium]
MKTKIMVLKCGMIIGLLVFFWGCSVILPDIRPFAVETGRMVSAVDNGYTNAETLLSMVEETGYPSEGQSNEKHKEESEKAETLWKSASSDEDPLAKLENNWNCMRKVLNALVIYSDELAALADSGTKGEEAAQGVADALNGVVETMANGALNIPGNLVNAFKELNKTLAEIRTMKALKKAVEEAQPVINTIIKIIFLNLDDLEKINNSAGRALRILHRNTNQPMINYNDVLIEEQQTIFEILTGILHYKRGGPRAPYYLTDVVKLDKELAVIGEENITIKDIEKREKYWLEQHQKIKGEINYLSPRYQAYKAREEKINILTSTGSLILRKGKFAILAYGKAHMKLKKTLGKKQRMSFVEFASVVQDVVDAYKGGQ